MISVQETDQSKVSRVYPCRICQGLGFEAPRVDGETCQPCLGSGRMIQHPDKKKPIPFIESVSKIDRSWTAGGRDWLWGSNPGHRRSEDQDSYNDY